MTRCRDERGSAVLWSCVIALVLVCCAALLVLAGVLRAEGERVKGAADLAALTGAREQGRATDGCAAARTAARLSGVEVVGCRIAGDEVEFVVSVEVRAAFLAGPTQHWLAARAHAGMVTGAPE